MLQNFHRLLLLFAIWVGEVIRLLLLRLTRRLTILGCLGGFFRASQVNEDQSFITWLGSAVMWGIFEFIWMLCSWGIFGVMLAGYLASKLLSSMLCMKPTTRSERPSKEVGPRCNTPNRVLPKNSTNSTRPSYRSPFTTPTPGPVRTYLNQSGSSWGNFGAEDEWGISFKHPKRFGLPSSTQVSRAPDLTWAHSHNNRYSDGPSQRPKTCLVYFK